MTPRSTTYQARPSTVFTELEDGTAVVLDLETKLYFALNTTGAHVWKCLAQRAVPVEELTSALCAEFAVEPERARADLEAVLSELAEERLVERLSP